MASPGNVSSDIAATDSTPAFYFGNAALDQVRGSGWFVGQFVPAELGLRHQTGVELKWGIHKDGDRRSLPWAHGNATTISILVTGILHVSLHRPDTVETVTLRQPGDYIAFGPHTVHSWEANGDTSVLSVRFPSVAIGGETAAAQA
jgi:hypothetical protein